MRIPGSERGWSRLAALLTILLVIFVVAGCVDQENTNPTSDAGGPNLIGFVDGELGFPHEVVTLEGSRAAALYLPIFIISVIIFVLVEGLLLWSAFRFRRKGTDGELPAQTHGNNRLELLWTAIPFLLVFVIFVGSTIVLAENETLSEEPSVTVDVNAFRFGWQFDYPDSGISIAGGGREGAPEMVLPVDETVRFRLSAADVIHSWYVPAFFFKRDAVPGRVNEFELTIEEPGVYGGQCAEFCGLAHADMFFNVRAVERAEYDAWVAEQTAPEPSPAPEGSPAPGASPAPDGSPGPDGSPAPDGTALDLLTTADDPLAFSPTILEATAGQAITVVYTNDSNVPHNVAFFEGSDASAPRIAASDIITGPGATAEVAFTAPETPGSYFFHCDVHPVQMIGTLEVAP